MKNYEIKKSITEVTDCMLKNYKTHSLLLVSNLVALNELEPAVI